MFEDFEKNTAAKLKNTVSDLNWYAFRFLNNAGFRASPRTGIEDAQSYMRQGETLPPELYLIVERYHKATRLTMKEADEFINDTWHFLHKYDKQLIQCIKKHST